MLTRLHFCPPASLHAFPCSAICLSFGWFKVFISFVCRWAAVAANVRILERQLRGTEGAFQSNKWTNGQKYGHMDNHNLEMYTKKMNMWTKWTNKWTYGHTSGHTGQNSGQSGQISGHVHIVPRVSMRFHTLACPPFPWFQVRISFVIAGGPLPLRCCQRPDPGETTERDRGSISVHVCPQRSSSLHAFPHPGMSTFSLASSPHFIRHCRRTRWHYVARH